MTKKVRIENADTSDHKITVQTWVKGENGEPDKLLREDDLSSPTELGEFYVWSDQYLVVVEKEQS